MSADNAKKGQLRAVPERDAAQTPPALPFDRVAAQTPSKPEAPSACQHCYGTGIEVIPGKGAKRCHCREENTQAKLLEAARIPRRYAECALEKYRAEEYRPDQSNGSQFKAWMKARDLAENYHATYKAQGRGLLFIGSVGVGKTHLAVGILHRLIQQGVECLFYEFGSLLKSIQDSYNSISRTSELSVLSPVYEAEVLVLDELGASIPTDWVRDTVAQIINKRYNDKKVTIFTTNYMDEIRKDSTNAILEKLQQEIASLRTSTPRNEEEKQALGRLLAEKVQYEKQILSEMTSMTSGQRIQKLTTLEDRIGVTMRSRLYEMCDTVVIKGADWRRKPRRADFQST